NAKTPFDRLRVSGRSLGNDHQSARAELVEALLAVLSASFREKPTRAMIHDPLRTARTYSTASFAAVYASPSPNEIAQARWRSSEKLVDDQYPAGAVPSRGNAVAGQGGVAHGGMAASSVRSSSREGRRQSSWPPNRAVLRAPTHAVTASRHGSFSI